MTASLNTDATLRVELVECQFTKEARYSISLQLSLPGAAAVQERTDVPASSTQPTFKPSSFEFRLPAGLPLVGSPPVELTLSASTPELDTAAAEGVVPHGVTTAVGEAMLELGDTLRELQQNTGPTAGKPARDGPASRCPTAGGHAEARPKPEAAREQSKQLRSPVYQRGD